MSSIIIRAAPQTVVISREIDNKDLPLPVSQMMVRRAYNPLIKTIKTPTIPDATVIASKVERLEQLEEKLEKKVEQLERLEEKLEEKTLPLEQDRTIYGSGEAKIDIHIFDKEIREIKIPTRFDKNYKSIYFTSLKQMINQYADDNVKGAGLEAVDIIYRDQETPANFLGSFADDVLAELTILLEKQTDLEIKKNIIDLLCEQYYFMKVTNGTCPSGRLSRGMQVYLMMKDIDDGVCYPKIKEVDEERKYD